jgi:hypothetical protein
MKSDLVEEVNELFADMKAYIIHKTAQYLDFQFDQLRRHQDDMMRRHIEGLKVSVDKYVEDVAEEFLRLKSQSQS